MNPQKTIFILGAGASCELGFPTSDGLRGLLLEKLELDTVTNDFKDTHFAMEVKKLEKRTEGFPTYRYREYVAAAVRLSDALPVAPSIDHLLDAHQDNEYMKTVGKLAITKVILEKEKASPLAIVTGPQKAIMHKLKADLTKHELQTVWLLPLMRWLFSGITRDQVNKMFDDVAFVVFNYDRCLEHFSYNALVSYYNISPGDAAGILNKLTIIHPYGQTGPLSWQRDQANVADFGCGEENIAGISTGIKTFTEITESQVLDKVKKLIQYADTLFLMGYGFISINNKLLRVNEPSKVKRVFATTYGVGEHDQQVAVSEIADMLHLDVRPEHTDGPFFTPFIDSGGCYELMINNGLRIRKGVAENLRVSRVGFSFPWVGQQH